MRGAGYFKQGSDIPKITKAACRGADDSVYKSEGSRQLFRTLGATKAGQNRPFTRYDDGENYSASDWAEAIRMNITTELFEENFVQYIGREQLIAPKVAVKPMVPPIAPADDDNEYADMEAGLGQKEYKYVDEKFITAVVTMLNDNRARSLAHEFSKRTRKGNYVESECDMFGCIW